MQQVTSHLVQSQCCQTQDYGFCALPVSFEEVAQGQLDLKLHGHSIHLIQGNYFSHGLGDEFDGLGTILFRDAVPGKISEAIKVLPGLLFEFLVVIVVDLETFCVGSLAITLSSLTMGASLGAGGAMFCEDDSERVRKEDCLEADTVSRQG